MVRSAVRLQGWCEKCLGEKGEREEALVVSSHLDICHPEDQQANPLQWRFLIASAQFAGCFLEAGRTIAVENTTFVFTSL